MVTAADVDVKPGPGWNAQGALNLPDTWYLIDKHRSSGFPMSVALFVSIFFEETACCNMLQQGTPAAIGPGQLQVSESGKVDFFASKDNFLGDTWDSSMTILAVNQATAEVFTREKPLHPELPKLTKDFILKDNEFSIKMHVKFMQWLNQNSIVNSKPMGLGGLLAAQTGGGKNVSARQAFKNGAAEIEKVMQTDPTINFKWSDAEWKTYYTKRRAEFIKALNTSRTDFHGNPVPKDRVKFWEFFVPDDFLQNPMGYIRCGF